MAESKSQPLFQSLTAAGPVVSPVSAARLHETLTNAATTDGWRDTLDAAWPALAPLREHPPISPA